MQDHHMMMMGMKMYFHTDFGDTILFKSCVLNSAGDLVAACVIFFLVAIFYEGLKSYREFLFRKGIKTYNISVIDPTDRRSCPPTCAAGDNSNWIKEAMVINKMFSFRHFYQTLLHILQVVISYTLMLAFMSFNVWICIAIALGAGVGYFLFCWRKLTIIDNYEHCN